MSERVNVYAVELSCRHCGMRSNHSLSREYHELRAKNDELADKNASLQAKVEALGKLSAASLKAALEVEDE